MRRENESSTAGSPVSWRTAAALIVATAALAMSWGCRPEEALTSAQERGSSRSSAAAVDLERYRLVDLTYTYDEETLYWPTATEHFALERQSYGETEAGYFYAANAFSTPEHGGTHLDAPIHFAASGVTLDEVPLRQLIVPVAVIDVSAQAKRDADYRLTVADVAQYEAEHGAIAPGSGVLLRTGWASRWPDALQYLGDDTPGDASNLHFPSFGAEAARLLVKERAVALLGVDTASIDYGASSDFIVHQIANGAGVPGLENLADLSALPPTGAWLIALPIKIGAGSGGPVRAVALVPR